MTSRGALRLTLENPCLVRSQDSRLLALLQGNVGAQYFSNCTNEVSHARAPVAEAQTNTHGSCSADLAVGPSSGRQAWPIRPVLSLPVQLNARHTLQHRNKLDTGTVAPCPVFPRSMRMSVHVPPAAIPPCTPDLRLQFCSFQSMQGPRTCHPQ